MNDKINGSVPRVDGSARRKLLRGSFAAPAALTLASGSAFAAASLNCVARQVATPVTGLTNDATTPSLTTGLIRVVLYAKANGGNSATFVRAADALAAMGTFGVLTNVSTSLFQTNTDYYCYSITGSGLGYTAGTRYTQAAATAGGSSGGTPTATSNYVALRFDSTGKLVAFTDAAGRSAVYQSCWTSFITGA